MRTITHSIRYSAPRTQANHMHRKQKDAKRWSHRPGVEYIWRSACNILSSDSLHYDLRLCVSLIVLP
ncbi:unnamed protein product [Sympodiomycopsis kandeliae]